MSKKRKGNGDFLFIAPGLIIYLLFMIVPIAVCFYFSFTNWDGISPTYKMIGLKNFQNILTDRSFWEAAKTTLILTVFTMVFMNVFGILIAVWMDKQEKIFGICKAIIFIPCILSSVVVSFIWSYIHPPPLPLTAGTHQHSSSLLHTHTNTRRLHNPFTPLHSSTLCHLLSVTLLFLYCSKPQ